MYVSGQTRDWKTDGCGLYRVEEAVCMRGIQRRSEEKEEGGRRGGCVNVCGD